jgi:type IV secretory pathway TraG/TraD family ATPase VirD4
MGTNDMGTSTVVAVVVIIVVWAIFSSNKMSRTANEKKVAAAKQASGKIGAAKWGSTDKMKGEGGIRLGFDKSGAILRFMKPRCHGLVVGKTGVGKGVWAISAILDMVGRASIILVDMKGNTTAVCRRHMATEGQVIVCSPFEKDKGIFPMELPKSTPYNPVAPLLPGKPGFIVGCKRLAILLGGDTQLVKSDNSEHFNKKTESLIAGVIAFVCERYPEKDHHLGKVRDVLTSSNGENFWRFVADAAENGSRFVKQKLARYAERTPKGGFRARASKEAADILSTAERYTDFIGNEDIEPSLTQDGFRFAPLKQKAGFVSLVCPLEHMHDDGGKWLKIMVASALHELLRGGRGKVPVYLFLDEADQYASPILHAALNISRQFGVSLVVMVQQISDIDFRYKQQAGAFINSPSWKLFIGPTDDQRTREVIEKLSGTTTVRSENVSLDDNNAGKAGRAFNDHAVPLRAGYEMGAAKDNECLIKVDGQEMIQARTDPPYWLDKTLVDENGKPKWDKDPYEE